MVTFEVSVTGLEAATAQLAAARRRLSDREPLLRSIAEDLALKAQARFASEGGTDGRRWPELSPDYKRWKDRHFPGRTILTLEGRLAGALGNVAETSEGIRRYSPDSLEFGTSIGYAAAHRMTRNPLPEPHDSDKEYWQDLANEWTGRVIAEALR